MGGHAPGDNLPDVVNAEIEAKCKHKNCVPMSHHKKRCLDCRAIIYEDYKAYCDG